MPDLNTPLTRYVALVPGIMGSTLSYPRGEIWGSNIIKNYWRLSNASTKLRWVGTKAEAELWKTIEVTPGVKLRLWNKTLNYLDAHPQLEQNRLIECPYDWRQSLQDSAVDIVRLLESRTGRRLSDTPGPQRERIAIVTHSMGALAIRVAIGKKLLDPGWIDRLIHMAPPLLGAPVAFRSLIYKTTVPFLNEIFRVVHFLNYHRFIDSLFNAFQTFPSIYELMPPTQIEFVLDAARKNTPLTGDWFDDLTLVNHAVQTHGFIAQAHKILNASHTPVFSIFSDFVSRGRTGSISPPPKKGRSRIAFPSMKAMELFLRTPLMSQEFLDLSPCPFKTWGTCGCQIAKRLLICWKDAACNERSVISIG